MSASDTDLQAIAQGICAKRSLVFGASVGSGAFKKTYRVKEASGKLFALKLVLGGRADRLRREIDAVRRCSHPNIGTLIDFQEESTSYGPAFYLLEPFLEGGTLADRLRGGPLSAVEVRALARQLSSALSYLAHLDLVHRDLKPENIMFGLDPAVPLLVDFGLVRDLAADSLTASHMARGPGTPLFASPEQLNNQKALIDWRADQFSLGATLCFAAFGFHPYAHDADGPLEAIERASKREQVSPRFSAAASAAGLEPLIQMVRPFPVQRYCFPDRLMNAWS